MSLRPAGCSPAGTPSSEGTALMAPSSLAPYHPPRLRLLTQGHLPRFSVRARGIGFPHPVFKGAGNRRHRPQTGGHSWLRPLPSITELRGLHQLAGATAPGRLSQPVRGEACVAAILPPRFRNINRILFRPPPVGDGLSPD